MNHSFDVNIAKKYGIEEAILLQHIYFWIEKNKANEKHYYNGTYWTYSTKKALAVLFPYLTPRKIDYALNNLIEKGLIITGYFNEKPTDRTLWYALTKMGYCILQNCEMENTKLENDNNIYNNTNTNVENTNIEESIINNTKEKENILRIFTWWNVKNIIKHSKLNETRIKAIKNKLKDYNVSEIEKAISNYATVLHDNSYYWNYTWSLEDFLNRKNGFTTFLDEGSNWVNYQKQKGEISRETSYPEYDNYNYL